MLPYKITNMIDGGNPDSPASAERRELNALSLCLLLTRLRKTNTGFIISDIEINQKPASSQPCHDGVEDRNVVFVCFCLEHLL